MFRLFLTSLTYFVVANQSWAQFDRFLPKVNLNPNKIINSVKDTVQDPLKAVREEFQRAKESAEKNLKRLSPDALIGSVERAIQQNISRELAKQGTYFNQATGEINLRNSKLGQNLKSWCYSFAQGNEREGDVQQFVYNTRSEILEVRIHIRHCEKKHFNGLGKQTLYSVTQSGYLKVDFRRKELHFDIDLGKLAPKINSRTFRAMAKGDLVTVVESVMPDTSSLLKYERKNDYELVRNRYFSKYGQRNVYFASKDFVSWAGSKTIGKYALTGIISGGSSVYPQIMADAREMASRELPVITQWLKNLGEREADQMARELLSGRKPRWPQIQFEIVVVPHHAREVNPQTGVATPWRTFNNLAFVIIYDPPQYK